jgi:cell wall-associated NlpC family hydrolase
VNGVLAVQSRIAELQMMMGQLQAPAATSAPASGAAATGSAFAAELGSALGASQTSSAGTGSTGRATGEGLIAAAKKYLGVPYKWGGTDPATGLDCSALVQRAMKDIGVDVPRVVADQRHLGTEVKGLENARPGDLIVLGGSRHIGIYVGDGKMLHAPRTGDVVKIGSVYETPTSIRRVLPERETTATVGVPAAASGAGAGVSDAVRRYDSLFASATARYGLPTGLLAAVAQVESGGDARAVSHAGAQGLMQIMPATARGLGVDPLDPAQAVDGAARLLRDHLRTFGSLDLALAAYNAGPGAVRRHDGVPPFAETQNYVRKVSALLGRTA